MSDVLYQIDSVTTAIGVTDIRGVPVYQPQYAVKKIIPDTALITYYSPTKFHPQGQVNVKLSGGQVKKDGTAGQNRTEDSIWSSPRQNNFPDWLVQLIEDVRPSTHPKEQ